MLSLLSGFGFAIFAGGSWLSYAGHRYFEPAEATECVAGFLILGGLGCIGTSLGFCLGPPLH
jgi:hypothetical protein